MTIVSLRLCETILVRKAFFQCNYTEAKLRSGKQEAKVLYKSLHFHSCNFNSPKVDVCKENRWSALPVLKHSEYRFSKNLKYTSTNIQSLSEGQP